MIFSVSNTISSLSAHATKLAVRANNIANVDTEGFKKSRAVLQEGPDGAVQVQIDQVNTPGPLIQEDGADQYTAVEMSNVDLSEEIPQTILTRTGYEANLPVIKTADEMLGSLLDILA
jgi:flagellar hook protein FlgE